MLLNIIWDNIKWPISYSSNRNSFTKNNSTKRRSFFTTFIINIHYCFYSFICSIYSSYGSYFSISSIWNICPFCTLNNPRYIYNKLSTLINPNNWITTDIKVCVYTTIKPNRVALNVSSCNWVKISTILQFVNKFANIKIVPHSYKNKAVCFCLTLLL